MSDNVTRNFRVKGQIRSMFTPSGGTAEPEFIANMNVELWQKSPLNVSFLGSSITDSSGDFIIDISADSPNAMIVDGQISNIFMKVYYNGQIIIGDIDASAGSFD